MEKYEPYRQSTNMIYNGMHCCYGSTNGLVSRDRCWDYDREEFYVMVPIKKGNRIVYERRYEKKRNNKKRTIVDRSAEAYEGHFLFLHFKASLNFSKWLQGCTDVLSFAKFIPTLMKPRRVNRNGVEPTTGFKEEI